MHFPVIRLQTPWPLQSLGHFLTSKEIFFYHKILLLVKIHKIQIVYYNYSYNQNHYKIHHNYRSQFLDYIHHSHYNYSNKKYLRKKKILHLSHFLNIWEEITFTLFSKISVITIAYPSWRITISMVWTIWIQTQDF